MEHSNPPPADDPAAELRICRAQLDMLLAHAPFATWTTDGGLCLTRAAGAALARAGLDPQALIGQHLTLLANEGTLGTGQAARFLDAHNQALHGAAASLTVDWRGHTYQVWIEPLPDHTGQIAGCMGMAVQAAPSASAGAQPGETEALAAQNQAILDSLTEGLVFFDLQGRITYMSPPALAVHGFQDLAEAQQPAQDYEPLFETLDLQGRPVLSEDWPVARVLRGERFVRQELEVRRRDTGHVCFASYSGALVYDPGGQPIMGLHTIRDISERVMTARALEAERARLAAIISHAPAGIVVADAEGRIVLTNPTADRLYRRPVPYGQPYASHAELQLVYLDGRPYDPRDLPPTRAALDGETAEEVELAILWPDGQRRELLANTAPIRGSDGSILGAVVLFQDVTERKRAEERVRRYAGRLRALHEMDRRILSALAAPEMAQAVLEHLPQLVPCVHASAVLCDLPRREMTLLAVHARGKTTPGNWRGPIDPAWEERFARLTNGEAYIVPDLQVASLSSPRDERLRAEGVRAHIYIPLRVQERLIGSLDIGLPDPAPVSPEQIESLHEIADELAVGVEQARLYAEVARYAGNLERMVSRRTRALEISEARFRAVFEEAGLGVVLLNRKGRVISSNPALQRILGCGGAELHGRPLADLLHPDEAPETTRRLEQLIAGQQPVYRAECRLRRADGTMADTSLTFSPVQPAKSPSRLVVALVEDISERKRTQQALIQSDRLAITGRLAASLAHEIGNPLQSVVGCLELVNEVVADGESPGEYLAVAMTELDRATRILNQMRSLNRRSDGEREVADVNDLLDRTLAVSKKQCQTHHVAVDFQTAWDLPPLSLIPDQIQSVFLNLVINAVDAMPGGGELRIHSAPTEAPRGVTVTFADTGVGIPPDALPHLFEPFHTTKEQGLGLGLYVSRQIIDDHGGRIEVQSEEGEGTTFTIWLPA